MKVFDVLTKEELELSEPITFEKRSSDYILSIPHAGLFIPLEFMNKYNVGKDMLLDTDMYTDEVYETGKGIKIVSLINNFCVNMNRFRESPKDESLPEFMMQDALHDLFLNGKPALKKELTLEESRKLIGIYYQYHQLLSKAITNMKKEKGFAFVLDCHSMNSVGLSSAVDPGGKRADLVVGTLDDTSADKKIIDVFCEVLQGKGFSFKKNDPYKGGFITQNYGKPNDKVHVIQLEVTKANYMDECLDSGKDFSVNKEGVKKLNKVISEAVKAAAEVAEKLV